MKQFKEMSIRDQGWIIATSEDLPDNQTEVIISYNCMILQYAYIDIKEKIGHDRNIV